MGTCGLIHLYRHYRAGGSREQVVSELSAYVLRVKVNAVVIWRETVEVGRLLALYVYIIWSRRKKQAQVQVATSNGSIDTSEKISSDKNKKDN